MSTLAQRAQALGTPVGFQTFAASTATALTVPSGAKSAFVTVDGDSARWRSDGTSPTTTVGMYLADGGGIEVGTLELPVIEFIAIADSATVSVTYYG